MKKSLVGRIFGGLFIIVVLLFFFIVLFFYQATRQSFLRLYYDDLSRTNKTLTSLCQPAIVSKNFADLNRLVKKTASELQIRITVIDTSGRVLADSEKEPQTMNDHRYRPEVQDALHGRVGTAVRFSTTVEKNLLYVASPVIDRGSITAVIRTSMAMREVHNLLILLLKRISLVILVALTLIAIALWYFSHSIKQPVGQLITAAQRVQQGKLETKVFLPTDDEFAQLAESFNQMTAELKDLFDTVEIERDRLQTIINAVPSSLIVIAPDGRVILANDLFKTSIASQAIENRYYWEIFHTPEVMDFIKKVQQEKTGTTAEFEFNLKAYLCSASYLPITGETVMILSDITAVKNVQKLKKDFVVNVSHELRTPLTAIKGFVETLQEEYPKIEKQYLVIIARHTERLINIVNDLLLLSAVEDKNQLAVEEVDINQLVNDTVKIFEHRIAEKGLELKINIAPELCVLRVDPLKFQQVLINLIDNAVKYTEKGFVAIHAWRADNQAVIEIADSGIGIPAEHIGRIFERFYVVDKSRSRRQGGTGLGLAIAKHIILLHGGEIKVESVAGQGSRFQIIIPQSSAF